MLDAIPEKIRTVNPEGCGTQLPLPADHRDLVDEEKDHGGYRDVGGKGEASEEVQGHGGPAEAGSEQGPANIRRGNCDRKARVLDVLQPEELTKCPDDDEELDRDSELSPALSSHGDILAGRAIERQARHPHPLCCRMCKASVPTC